MWFTPIFNTHKIHFESLRLSIIYTPFPQLCNVYIDNSKLILNVNLMLKCRCKKGGMANHYILFFYHFSSWYGFPRHRNVPQIVSSDYNNVKLHMHKLYNLYRTAFESLYKKILELAILLILWLCLKVNFNLRSLKSPKLEIMHNNFLSIL